MLKRMTKNTKAIVDGDLGSVYDESSVNLTCHTNDWVIDSGSFVYVTVHRNYFTSYINGDYSYIRMGNEGASKIMSIRDIWLKPTFIIICCLKMLNMYHIFTLI